MNYDVNLDFVLFSQRLHFLSKQKSISGTVFHIFFFFRHNTTKRTRKGHTYLVIFLGDFAGDTLTLIAGVHAAGTVPATTLDEEAAWPEDGVCSLQLFPDRH